MAAKNKKKVNTITIQLPFNLGFCELEYDKAQQKAAWSLYVELSTRIAIQPMQDDEGSIRDTLTSLFNIFGITRQILRDAGPEIAKGSQSLGRIAIDVLNKGLRPFLAKWHILLTSYEEKRPSDQTKIDHERNWQYKKEFENELNQIREQLNIYVDVLSKISEVG